MNDEFAIYFGLKHDKDVPKEDAQEDEPSRKATNMEISGNNLDLSEQLQLEDALTQATETLNKTQGSFADKMNQLKRRATLVHKEQERLKKNLMKYNNFVKEKQQKVQDGDRVYNEEIQFQSTIQKQLEEKRQLCEHLERAMDLIKFAVEKREIFKNYLQSVVDSEASTRNRYKDIGELIKRCETLVITRDKSKLALQKHEEEILKQKEGLAFFKEAQNERILNLSSRQNALQDALYQIQARKESKQRILDNREKSQVEKELQIANIRLSVLTLWQYVNSKKIHLASDLTKNSKGTTSAITKRVRPPHDLETQLEAVKAHIEDLQVVIARVKRSEEAQGYMSPLVTHSELRLDY